MSSLRDARHRTIDGLAMWSSLAIYAGVWLVVTTHAFASDRLIGGIVVTAIYVSLHVYEIRCRGHCYMSADSTAAPLTFVACLGLGAIRWWSGAGELLPVVGDTLVRFAGALMLGHVLAIAWSALLTTVLGVFVRSGKD